MTKAEQKAAREQRDHDWRWFVGSMQGRRILAELMQSCGLLAPVMSDNPLRTAHAEGRRSIGGEIYARITEITESGDRPALLAEVLAPNVRDNRPERDRDAGNSADD